jgi:hypothetical protein
MDRLQGEQKGVMRESNSRPPAPKAGIIPLDQSPTFVPIREQERICQTTCFDQQLSNLFPFVLTRGYNPRLNKLADT